MKTNYCVIWIEGMEPISGEKIKTLDKYNHTYTTFMTEALRIKTSEIEEVRELLKNQGVADWVTYSDATFHPTSYVPKGTRWKL